MENNKNSNRRRKRIKPEITASRKKKTPEKKYTRK